MTSEKVSFLGNFIKIKSLLKGSHHFPNFVGMACFRTDKIVNIKENAILEANKQNNINSLSLSCFDLLKYK